MLLLLYILFLIYCYYLIEECVLIWELCNCKWVIWDLWLDCFVFCGGGIRYRLRLIQFKNDLKCGVENCVKGGGCECRYCNIKCYYGMYFDNGCSCYCGWIGFCCSNCKYFVIYIFGEYLLYIFIFINIINVLILFLIDIYFQK